MVKLTQTQKKIRTSLIIAISNNNLQEVQNIFESNKNKPYDIQAALSYEVTMNSDNSDKSTILDLAITRLNVAGEVQVEIIKLIWQKADQKTRDFLCSTKYDLAESSSFNTINALEELQERTNDSNKGPVLREIIQEIEEHKRVNNHIKEFHNLYNSSKDINLEEAKKVFNFGDDQEKVFTRLVENTSNKDILKKGFPGLANLNIEEQGIEDAEHIRKLKEQETPEKNDTNFWSEHKGKIALGVTGLCVAGAIAAYMLAYPVVALALTVLAAVILMGAGITKVCEKVKNPSVDKVFDKNEQLLNQ